MAHVYSSEYFRCSKRNTFRFNMTSLQLVLCRVVVPRPSLLMHIHSTDFTLVLFYKIRVYILRNLKVVIMFDFCNTSFHLLFTAFLKKSRGILVYIKRDAWSVPDFQQAPCPCKTYSFKPIRLKLYRCFNNGLKICMCFFSES